LRKISLKNKLEILILLLSWAAVYFVVWEFTGEWPFSENPYNSYVLQARAWLEGHMDLGRNYSHLEIAEYAGKYFVSFPPIASVILLPFVILGIPDGVAALIISLSGAYFTYKLCEKHKVENPVFWSLFLMVASNVLLVGVNAWVWFIAQNISFLFTVSAIYFASKKESKTAFFLWALAVGARPFQIVYLPLLVCILTDGFKLVNIKNLFKSFLPAILVGMGYMLYNYLRFDNVFEFGHNYLPEFVEAENGQFHLSYMWENLKSLVRLPGLGEGGILEFPRFNGVSVFLVFPIVIYSLIFSIKNIKNPTVAVGLGSVIVHVLLIVSHRTMGGFHFGNRYFIDVMPCLFYLLVICLPRESKMIKITALPLFLWGMGVNVVGIISMFLNP